VQRPLLPHDFSVASQIREVQAGIDGESRELEIEVVGNRTHYRVVAHERLTHGSSIAHIQLDASKSVSLELPQQRRQPWRRTVRQRYLILGSPQQIESARRSLTASS